jgi:hypothetical protein
MAAGLGFKDFVTGEVLTANDVDGYLMQNIWVFASAAARDAAVTSPQEGNACYLKDTDAVMTYSGSAWVAVGGAGGGMTLINTGGTTLTGASVSVSSIPTTYNNLYVVIRDYVTNTDNDGLLVRFNSDTASNYAQRVEFASGAALTWNATRWNISEGNDNSVGDGLQVLEIFDYANTATYKMANYYSITTDGTNTANYRYTAGAGLYKSTTTAITSITLLPEALGTFSGGTVFVYGVK